jgi:hypothetical protein
MGRFPQTVCLVAVGCLVRRSPRNLIVSAHKRPRPAQTVPPRPEADWAETLFFVYGAY